MLVFKNETIACSKLMNIITLVANDVIAESKENFEELTVSDLLDWMEENLESVRAK